MPSTCAGRRGGPASTSSRRWWPPSAGAADRRHGARGRRAGLPARGRRDRSGPPTELARRARPRRGRRRPPAVRGAARRRAGRRPGPRPARAAQGGAGHRHRRDQPDGRGRAVVVDAGLARRPVFDATHRADPAGDRAGLAGVGRPAGRPGRAAGAGRGGAAVVEGRARGAGRRSPSPRSARPTWPGWRWSWRCGAPSPATCRSSTRRRPGRWTRPGACSPTSARSTGTGRRPDRAGPRDGGAAAAPPPGPHGARRPRPRAGLARPACWPRCWRIATCCGAGPTSLPTDVGAAPGPAGRPGPAPPARRRAGAAAAPATGPTTWPGAWAWPPAGADPAEAGPLLAVGLPRPHRPGPGRRRALRAAGGHRGLAGRRRPAGRASRSWRWPRSTGAARNGRIRLAAPLDRRPARRRSPATRWSSTPAWCGTATATTWWPASSAGSGGCASGTVERRPASRARRPRRALVDRVRATGLAALPWTPAPPGRCRRGSASCAPCVGEPWPDVSDAALRRGARRLAGPVLAAPAPPGRADLERARPGPGRCGRWCPPAVAGDLDRLAPAAVTVPSGRRVPLDYGDGGAPGDPPVLAVRVQEMFGSRETPDRGRRAGAGGAAPAVAGGAAGAGDQRPGRVLGRVLAATCARRWPAATRSTTGPDGPGR